jgi:hypothetical protein
MATYTFSMRSKVWADKQVAGWHFVTLPVKQSAQIRRALGPSPKPSGGIAVVATIGRTSWKTSLYIPPKSRQYVMALKADVRKKEGVVAGKLIDYSVKLTA